MADIRETSILILHDAKRVLVDTNVKGVASLLLRRGFVEFGGKISIPYRRFEGTERQVSFRGALKKRSSAKVKENMAKARAKRAKAGEGEKG